jgi:ABC-type phosphate/phosphonate transport system substrate-binding protein
MNRHHLLLFLVVLALLLVGCRRGGGAVATAIVADTPTPRSTPLPPVATDPPPGAEDNPMLMVFVNPGGGRTQRALTTAAGDLAEQLAEETSLTVEVEVVDTQAAALAALCGSGRGQVAAAWINGLTYAAAVEQGCGTGALQVERGEGRNARTAEEVRLIANRSANIQSVGALADIGFCRVGFDDFYTWLMPSLMLRAGGVDPLDMATLVDVGDVGRVIEAVAEGRQCDAAGVASSDFADLADSQTRAEIANVGQPVSVPFAILTFPPPMPLGAQWALTDAFEAIAIDAERVEPLQLLLEQDALLPVEEGDFSQFLAFLRSTRVNLAALGQ